MKRYRFYLLANVVWSYLMHLLLAFTNFTFLFPSFCLVIEPVVAFPFASVLPLFLLTEFCVLNFALSVVLSVLYRRSQTFTGRLARFFDESRWIYVAYALVHFFLYATSFAPELLAFEGEKASRLQFVRENPELRGWAERGAFLCFPTTKAAHDFILYAICLLVLCFCWSVVAIVVLYRKVRSARRKVAVATTYELQRMLFVALSFQATIELLINLNLKNGSQLTSIAMSLLSWHGVVDYFVMLYFVSPWRREIVGWMRQLGGKQTGGD
ncbi:hypothetical protein M3Y99_01385300 [Aphelenchoides fujianensis]|nr:hypothetical protein M3Y99_01385300 [Aphelenchoides fujianensis]